ncbi:MAG: DinB family protein [Planctomycetes bacterium]|nr:DinB family protein [Planctomycetota bacterium]
MSGPKDVIRGQLELGQQLINMMTKDLSDAEYFKPAAPNTNHAGWLLGHIACSEDWGMSLLCGSGMRCPKEMHDIFRGGTKCVPDASRYPARTKIDEMFRDTRAAMLELLRGYDEGRWENPSPESAPRQLLPTMGAIWGLMGSHQFWHIGQLATCRSVLGKKPVLIG